MKNKTGTVYLIGAGPGDPALITVKGYRILKEADVILHDYLIDPRILDHTKPTAEKIMTGKSGKHHFMEQDQINKLLVTKAKEYDIVVRLKNGDPFIFGRGGEEIIHLATHHIPFEVIPGVSSSIGAATAANIPLTHRDFSGSVSLITGHKKDNSAPIYTNADTLVYVMGVKNLNAIVDTLLKNNLSPTTPCLILENGTLSDQRITEATLATIVKKAEKTGISPPALFIVGQVLRVYQQLKKLL